MPKDSSGHLSEIEKKTAFYLRKLHQIDRILKRPVETLISQALESGKSKAQSPRYRFPAWLSERPESPDEHSAHSPPTQAVCFATLQRLWRIRRRFDWLARNEDLKKVKNGLPEWFYEPHKNPTLDSVARLFQSKLFGNFNPLTASYIFRVLVEGGEAQAHSSFGFLAIFCMFWSLNRRFPDRLTAGAD